MRTPRGTRSRRRLPSRSAGSPPFVEKARSRRGSGESSPEARSTSVRVRAAARTTVEPRWDDVLRRAGVRGRRERPRAVVVAALAVVAAALAAAALTIAALAPGEPRVSAHVVDATLGVDATFSAHPRAGFS